MADTLALTPSLENYLEAIFHIVKQKSAARAKDIARRLGVSNSSVTNALRALAARQLVNYAPYDIVTLTADGRRMAADVVRRHRVLRDFFVEVLGLAGEEAEEAACRMEHVLSEAVEDRLRRLLGFLRDRRGGGRDLAQILDRLFAADGAGPPAEQTEQPVEEVSHAMSETARPQAGRQGEGGAPRREGPCP